jgi:hypothetical protein
MSIPTITSAINAFPKKVSKKIMVYFNQAEEIFGHTIRKEVSS